MEEFAAFPLVYDEQGRAAFADYYWELVNNGTVVVVKATTARGYSTPDEAFAAAKALVAHLTQDDYVLVNRVDLGVRVQPISDDRAWRGTMDVCLWRSADLGDVQLGGPEPERRSCVRRSVPSQALLRAASGRLRSVN